MIAAPYSYGYFTTPFYGLPYYGPTPVVETPPASAYYPDPPSRSDSELTLELERLRLEVEALRQQQLLRQDAAQAAPAKQEPVVPVVLVYNDGRRQEIVNYAIAGQMLLIVDPGFFARVPLSDLDLTATRKANDERGVRFLASAR